MNTASVVVNRSGRLVFPENLFSRSDFRGFHTLADFEAVIARDFGATYRTDDVLAARARRGDYASRRELLRDIVANLYWAQRYALTMYEVRPTRWRDVPRSRAGVYLPVAAYGADVDLLAPVEMAYRDLPATDPRLEDLVFHLLRELVRNRRGDGTAVAARNPTVAEAIAAPQCRTWRLRPYDADVPSYSDAEVIDFEHPIPELEALMRHTMVIRSQLRWEPKTQEAVDVRSLQDDDVVMMLLPRDEHAAALLRGDDARGRAEPAWREPVVAARTPAAMFPPVDVRRQFRIWPRLEALSVYKGELVCTNDDLIRNAAVSWPPMTAEDIRRRTGIVERRYSALTLDDMALRAARAALARTDCTPGDIGAVVVCTSTATRTMPSTAARLAARLGIVQTHAAFDLVAGCAGLSYGLAEAVRLLQEVRRPVLLVTADKLSDKVGRVRTSRMLFGDGAAALVVGVAHERPDVEVFQTYASGPLSQVESMVWPNPAFDDAMTVDGAAVKALIKRYLRQMRAELERLPDHDGQHGCLLDAIELIIPHQANQVMVTALASEVGLPVDRLYFDISHVGNTSAASIPIAIHDAVAAGVIDRPRLVFAPGFGAGALAGYACLRVDPAIVAIEITPDLALGLAAPVLEEAA